MAIDPKLVSIKNVEDLPKVSLINLVDGNILCYDGEGVLKLLDTDEIIQFQNSDSLGLLKTTDTPPTTGKFRGDVMTAGTYTNFKNSGGVALAFTQAELDANLAFIYVVDNVSTKALSLKPQATVKSEVIPTNTTDAVNGKGISDYVKVNALTKEENTEAGGKNLFDKSKIIEGKRIVTATGADFVDATAVMTQPIPVKASTSYFISGVTSGQARINYRFLDVNNTPLKGYYGGSEVADFSNLPSKNIQSPATAVAMQFVFKQNNIGSADGVQLEEGTVATAFEPYISKIKYSSLNLTPLAAVYLQKGNYAGTAQDIVALVSAQNTSISTLNGKVIANEAATNSAIAQAQSAISISNSKISSSEKGVSNGVATLNSSGKIPSSQIDLSGAVLKGNWNALTNTPTLADGTGTTNNYYLVTADGTQNLGGGNITFEKGDTVIYSSEGKWLRNPKSVIPGLISDVGLSETSLFSRIGDGLFNIYNENTKEIITFKKVTTFPNGIAISDSNIDGNLYRKIGTEYFANSNFLKSGRVDLKSYGCKADGVSDDRVLFQSLIDILSFIGGGTIDLPVGKVTYYNNFLVIKDNVSIKGKGLGVSSINPISNSASDLSGGIYNTTKMPSDGSVWNPLTNIVFEDFKVDCSGLHNRGTSTVGRKGFFILGMENCHFNRVWVHKSIGTGIGCDFLSRSSITNCLITDCGMYIGDGVASEIGQSGIGIGSCSQLDESVVIDGNWCINNGNYGIFVETQKNPSGMKSRYAKIVNNHIFGSRYGIGNKGSGGAIIDGNTCYNNSRFGILISQESQNNIVTNNDCGYNLKSGIQIDNGESGFIDALTIISNNKAHHNTEYGISFGQGTKPQFNPQVENNKVYYNGLSGILTTFILKRLNLSSNTIFSNGQSGTVTNCYGIYARGGKSNVFKDNILYDDQATKTQLKAFQFEKGNQTGDTASIVKDNIMDGYAVANAYGYASGTSVADIILQNNITS